MRLRIAILAGLALATVAFAQQDTGFQERYAANLNIGESYIEIINTGANGAPALGPGIITGLNGTTGNLCVNVYAIDPNEELVACCSCLVTPDQTVSLGVNLDLTSQNLTGPYSVPTSATVALIATLAGTGGSGTNCSDSAALVTSAANGMAAWGTTLHATPIVGKYATTSTPFTNVTAAASGVTATNLASLVGRCASIIGNGSGHGICTSCTLGADTGFNGHFLSTVWSPISTGSPPYPPTGSGTLDGNTVTFNTFAAVNAGQIFDTTSFPPSWNSSPATYAGGSVSYSSTTAAVLAADGALPTPQSVTFSESISNPVLMVDFASAGMNITFPAGSSLTLLSSNNCGLLALVISCPTASYTSSDGFAVQVNGTFGPGTPLTFTYTSGAMNGIGFSIAEH